MAEQFNKCGTRLHVFCTKFFRKAQNPTPVPSGGAVQVQHRSRNTENFSLNADVV